ncbi:hypothetical protein JKA74_00060 [Marivirga sp. S37H4]|uniref:Uncharacterized protein n=1 Tax=Marivirga aurantiaca TaxID=2802615 RepID=A0A934WUU7_9BACT|nr:hypothetical protein [Marivirga aurantiaca]MBK6263408.1 hypothetical protein [Marivirga aurantiaca]
MKTLILIISISFIVFLLIRAIRKNKNKEESKLSVFEHPSTFKKPDIEMVSKSIGENINDKKIETILFDDLNQKEEKE